VATEVDDLVQAVERARTSLLANVADLRDDQGAFKPSPLAAWVSSQRSLTHLLRDLATELEGHSLDAMVFPHFLSGPLDARQRLEFLRFHIERHSEQVRRVRSLPSFPE
jgi:hypothetical protein